MKARAPLFLVGFVSLGCIAFACGGGSDNLPPPPPPPPVPTATESSAATAPTSTSTAPARAPTPPVVLTPGSPAPDPAAPLPTVKITAPTREQIVAADKAADFSVKLDVKNWATQQGSSHVHLILDNKPYKAIYDTKAPVKLSELAGGEALAEGLHVLVAFPSRATHESVKTTGALAIVPFWIGKKGDLKDDPTKKPMLIYSRPKGEYKGEAANHVLVDFYVANVTLAEGKERVTVNVTGPGIDRSLDAKVEKFGNVHYLDNLQNGSYTLKLELVDGAGKAIPGPWNSTTRSIQVNRDAVSDPVAAHGDHGTADAGTPAKDAGAPKPLIPAKDAGAPKAVPTVAPSPTPTQPLPSMGGTK